MRVGCRLSWLFVVGYQCQMIPTPGNKLVRRNLNFGSIVGVAHDRERFGDKAGGTIFEGEEVADFGGGHRFLRFFPPKILVHFEPEHHSEVKVLLRDSCGHDRNLNSLVRSQFQIGYTGRVRHSIKLSPGLLNLTQLKSLLTLTFEFPEPFFLIVLCNYVFDVFGSFCVFNFLTMNDPCLNLEQTEESGSVEDMSEDSCSFAEPSLFQFGFIFAKIDCHFCDATFLFIFDLPFIVLIDLLTVVWLRLVAITKSFLF